jgi:hypothetical protein
MWLVDDLGKSFSSGLVHQLLDDASDTVHSGLPFDLDQRASTGAGHLLSNRETHAKQQTANEHKSTRRKKE